MFSGRNRSPGGRFLKAVTDAPGVCLGLSLSLSCKVVDFVEPALSLNWRIPIAAVGATP